MLKLKLQYFGHLMRLIWKDPDAGKDWGQEEKGTTEDEMVGWHQLLNGHGFGYTRGVGDGQGGLECCNSWGHKESDTIEELNWLTIFLGHASILLFLEHFLTFWHYIMLQVHPPYFLPLENWSFLQEVLFFFFFFFFFYVVVVLFKNSITYQYLGAGVWLLFYL